MTSEPGDGKTENDSGTSDGDADLPKDDLLADVSGEEGGGVNLFTDDDGDDLPEDGTPDDEVNLASDGALEAEDAASSQVAADGEEPETGEPDAASPDEETGEDEAELAALEASTEAQAEDGAEGENSEASEEAVAQSAEEEGISADVLGDEADTPDVTDASDGADSPSESPGDDNDDAAALSGESTEEGTETSGAPDDAGTAPSEPASEDGETDTASPDADKVIADADPAEDTLEVSEPDGDGQPESAENEDGSASTSEALTADEKPVSSEAETVPDAEIASSDLAAETLSKDSFWDNSSEAEAEAEADSLEETAAAGSDAVVGNDIDPATSMTAPDDIADEEDSETAEPAPEPEPTLVSRPVDTGAESLFAPSSPAEPATPNPLLAAGLAGGGIREEEPEEEPEIEEEYLEEDDEEELQQSTFLRKLGVGAGLLVVGALAGLWVGPKIAPGLPAGLGPVRDFLMPGQSQAQTEIEALRDELDRAIATLPRPRTESQIAAIVAGSVAANRTEYEDRIAALEVRVEELIDVGSRADATGFEPRIAALENRIGGLAAQLTSLNQNLTTFESDGSISDEAIAQMAGFTANVEAVRAEVSGLVEQIATLEAELDETRAAAERRVQDAESEIATAQEQARNAEAIAETSAAFALIEAALESGQPFPGAIARLEPFTDIPAPLAAVADSGVATLTALRNGFPDAAHAAIRASIQTEADDSVLGRMGAFVNAQVANRSLTPQEGMSTDAILSRAEEALRQPDLATASAEIETLDDEARTAMGDWAVQLLQRVQAEGALEELRETLQAAQEG